MGTRPTTGYLSSTSGCRTGRRWGAGGARGSQGWGGAPGCVFRGWGPLRCLPSRAALALGGSPWQRDPVLPCRSLSALSLARPWGRVHHPHL